MKILYRNGSSSILSFYCQYLCLCNQGHGFIHFVNFVWKSRRFSESTIHDPRAKVDFDLLMASIETALASLETQARFWNLLKVVLVCFVHASFKSSLITLSKSR